MDAQGLPCFFGLFHRAGTIQTGNFFSLAFFRFILQSHAVISVINGGGGGNI